MQIGILEVEIAATGMAGVQRNMDQTHRATQKVADGLNDVDKATRTTKSGVDQLTQSNQRLRASQDQAASSTANLGRLFREKTTALFGVNVAAIAVGTTLGNFATQLGTRFLLAIINAATETARLTNALAAIPSVGRNAVSVFNQLREASIGSSQSLEELVTGFDRFARSVEGTTVPMERALELFTQHTEAMKILQQQTIASSFKGMMSDLGSVLVGFDNLLGISTLIQGVFNGLAAIFRFVRDMLPGSKEVETLQALQNKSIQVAATVIDLRAKEAAANRVNKTEAGERLRRAEEELRLTKEKIKAIETAGASPETRAKVEDMENRINRSMHEQVSIMRESNIEQQIQNKLFEAEAEARRAGHGGELDARQKANIEADIRKEAYAQSFKAMRDSLLTQEALEMQSFQKRTEQIQGFYRTGLIEQEEHDAMMEQEFFRSTVRMQQIQHANAQHLIQAQMAAGQQMVAVLQLLGQKSKIAAVAAIALNTALQVAQATQNILAAQTRALAELGPVAGPPVAASIGAWGALQIAGIIAAGALQAGQALKGSKPPGAGGGGGGTPARPPGPEEQEKGPSGRTVTLVLKEGMLFSSEQMKQVIDQLNEEVKNGATLIATETAS